MSYDLAIATRTRPKPDAIEIRITYVQAPPSEPAEAIPWID